MITVARIAPVSSRSSRAFSSASASVSRTAARGRSHTRRAASRAGLPDVWLDASKVPVLSGWMGSQARRDALNHRGGPLFTKVVS